MPPCAADSPTAHKSVTGCDFGRQLACLHIDVQLPWVEPTAADFRLQLWLPPCVGLFPHAQATHASSLAQRAQQSAAFFVLPKWDVGELARQKFGGLSLGHFSGGGGDGTGAGGIAQPLTSMDQ